MQHTISQRAVSAFVFAGIMKALEEAHKASMRHPNQQFTMQLLESEEGRAYVGERLLKNILDHKTELYWDGIRLEALDIGKVV